MLPRISVVTSSYNQGRFLSRTVESVLGQGYPDVEHIVVDGMSGDETPAVLARYPHLRVVREPDGGQAEAINKGFRLATGDVYCFLNSDDTLLPGALHRVARAIDPARGQHVVVGRCLYTDEDDRFTGREHPWAYQGPRRLLEAWKPHTIPQPATFWTAEAWRRCGPLDEREQLVLDYDLFCRLARVYPFHLVDAFLATYRLHRDSKSCTHAQRHVYRQSLRVSQRYWPPPTRADFWRLLGSFAVHRWGRAGTRLTATGWELRRRGRRAAGAAATLAGALLTPALALRRTALRARLARPLCRTWDDPTLESLTLSWRCFSGVHEDGCVGPALSLPVDVRPGQRWLRLAGQPALPCAPLPPLREVRLDGRTVAAGASREGNTFSIHLNVDRLPPGTHQLDIDSACFVVADDYFGNRDYRPLCFRLLSLTGG
jgi:glycosyltransferase involved in cell wall biosynthesis